MTPRDDDKLEQPPREGLGEFAETIIDGDGQLDPDVLEEPGEDDGFPQG